MLLISFSAAGWESWGVGRRPLIRDGVPVLVDEDLRFEDGPGAPRPAAVVNRWLRELPVNGAPAPRTWRIYAESLRGWLEFCDARGVDPLGAREELRAVLSVFAGARLAGELGARWDVATWNLHMAVLSRFYRWAVEEGYAAAVPFTFVTGHRIADGVVETVQRNAAKLRTPKPHATIKYLERDFADVFVRALAGLDPDGEPDAGFRGREVARNAAMGRLVLASGLRSQEFTHLTVHELPPLPPRESPIPVPFPLGHALTKGDKQRTTWISYPALTEMHQYIALDRAAAADGTVWRPPPRLGGPLVVEEPDFDGARINGQRRPWRSLTLNERLRLVSTDGTSPLIGLQSNGEPFTDWATVFRRTSRRVRDRFDPRFPIVSPHRLRHSFAMQTLEDLISGYYRQAAEAAEAAGGDAALALYLNRADPLMVLRDLLGHSSVTTTQIYIARLDITRVYRDAYHEAFATPGQALPASVAAELGAEFPGGR